MILTSKFIRRALLAVSHDTTRQNINQLAIEQGRVIATDGHRLHRIYDPTIQVDGQILIPRWALEAMAKEFQTISVLRDGDSVTLSGRPGEYVEIGHQSGRTFPPWRQVIPTQPGDKIEQYKAKELRKVVAEAQGLSDDGLPKICFPDGGPTINANYILDAVKASGAGSKDEITLRYSGKIDPLEVLAEDFYGVIMPMRY